jgi:hypothetical protein
LIATATASAANPTTMKDTTLPINSIRGGACITAAVNSVASSSRSGIKSSSASIGISS